MKTYFAWTKVDLCPAVGGRSSWTLEQAQDYVRRMDADYGRARSEEKTGWKGEPVAKFFWHEPFIDAQSVSIEGLTVEQVRPS